MLNYQELSIPGFEQVVKITDDTVGLRAIIAIHDTRLGPGLGGIRIFPYPSEQEALKDVLRLAEGMTYKSAMAQSGFGGAKGVIIADPNRDKSPSLLRAFGKAINGLKGRYIGSKDSGCDSKDLTIIAKDTKYVCGMPGSLGSGDPSPFTAWGIVCGIKATLKTLDGSSSLRGKTIAIQGIGHVGKELLRHLFWEGAQLIICDVDRELVSFYTDKKMAISVPPEEILSVPCDILSPNAMGGVLNPQTIDSLQCRGIAGAANNQLSEPKDGELLMKREILYAPDFVISAGGLINVLCELSRGGYSAVIARDMVDRIYDQLLDVYGVARKRSTSPNQAAMDIVHHRLQQSIGRRESSPCFQAAVSQS